MENKSTGCFDIAIVGGGMVGITQALLLARAHTAWRIALIESFPLKTAKNPTPTAHNSFDNRSTALAEGSRPILESCGVWSNLGHKLTPIRRVHVSDRGHFAGTTLNAEDFHHQALGYVVENLEMGRALGQCLAKCPGVEVIAPAQVQSLTRLAAGWSIALNNDRALQTELLILADGTGSALGQRLGIQYQLESYGQSAMITNIESDHPHGGVAYERFTDQGPVALLPLGYSDSSGRSALVWTLPNSAVEDMQAVPDSEFCQRLQKTFGSRAGRFVRVGSRHCYPLQLALAKEQIRAGLVMMGNAAHFLHPVAGQGFNLALRDCHTLAQVLSESPEKPGDLALLQRYEQRQALDQVSTIGLSHNLVKLFSTASLPSALVRSLGLLSLDAFSPAKSLFAQQAMGFPLASAGG